jgi:dipicolinate synthase subunit A
MWHKGVKHMSHQYQIGIFGGDLRQVYMTNSLLQKGYRVTTYSTYEPVNHENCSQALTLSELCEKCNILIGPIPFSKDQVFVTARNIPSDLTLAHVAYLIKEHHVLIGGNLPSPITELCDARHISYYDLMKNEKIAILNAIATAEGTIMEAIAGSDRNLHESNCLVLGYGRCAKVLSQKLKAMDARVTIAARSEEALAYSTMYGYQAIPLSNMKCLLPNFHYIFNTIPSLILDRDCLELVDRHATIIDIASAPGGVDFEYAKHLNLNAKLCLGLPGKISPRSSAEFLVAEICTFIKERSD